MRKICTLAAVALSLTVVETATAAPAPVSLTFDHAVLSTPATPDTVLVSPATPVTMTAQYDPSTGDFTVAPSTLYFPTSTFTNPLPGSIRIVLGAPASGTFDASTGQLTLTADFVADITVNSVGSCTIDPGTQTYSTSNSTIYPGTPFPLTATGLSTGPGAFTGGWATVPPGTGDACGLLNSAVDGHGGFWFSEGIAPPASSVPAKLSLSARPASATVTAGGSVNLTATVKNTGGTSAKGVTVCVVSPKPLHVHGPKCKALGTLAPGSAKEARFELTTAKSASGSYKLQLTSAGSGLTRVKRTSTVKVKAKR
jgi:hypothetical protein